MIDNLPYGRPLALITGAYGGMGLACAQRIGRNHDLVLTDYDPRRLEATTRTLIDAGHIVIDAVAGDIEDKATLGRLTTSIAKAGTLAACIHTAALSPSLASWRDIMRVNVVGTDRLLRAVEPLLAKGTVMVMIASTAGHLPPGVDPALKTALDHPLAADFLDRVGPLLPELPDIHDDKRSAAYMISKWWMLRTCEALATPWGKKGARIATISPGMIWTAMGRKEAEGERIAAMVTAAPLTRWGTPMDIAGTVEFLISDRASFITGSDVKVDGGSIGKFHATGEF